MSVERRRSLTGLLALLTAPAAAKLNWTRPIIKSVITPAHAQTSDSDSMMLTLAKEFSKTVNISSSDRPAVILDVDQIQLSNGAELKRVDLLLSGKYSGTVKVRNRLNQENEILVAFAGNLAVEFLGSLSFRDENVLVEEVVLLKPREDKFVTLFLDDEIRRELTESLSIFIGEGVVSTRIFGQVGMGIIAENAGLLENSSSGSVDISLKYFVQ